MSTETTMFTDQEAVAKLQQLHQFERKLSDTIIQLRAEHSLTSTTLEALKAEALAEFKTSDIVALRELYRNIMEENTSNIKAFELSLNTTNEVLEKVKAALAELDRAV